MPILYKIGVLLHLLGFAGYIGAGFAQLRFIKASRRDDAPPVLRDHYEVLAAEIVSSVEIPSIFLALISGLVLLFQNASLLEVSYMKIKLGAVILLLFLSHWEMFNARRIVSLRATERDAARDRIEKCKRHHEVSGAIGTLLVMVVLVMILMVRW